MALSVDEALFRRLQQHPSAVANDPRAHGIVEDAVWLHTDLGPSYYLTRDGRFLFTDAFEPREGVRPLPEADIPAALVLGARKLGAPALLNLLPTRPAHARDCAKCEGSRRWSFPAKNGDAKIICPDCRGLGWTAEQGPAADDLAARALE